MSTLVDLPPLLWPALWTSTLAMALICCLRHPLRQVFGPHVAYLSWAAVPIVILSTLLPARTQTLTEAQMLQPLIQTTSIPNGFVFDAFIDMPPSAWIVVSCLWLAGVLASTVILFCHQRRFTRAMGQLRKTSMRGVFEAEHDPGLPVAIGIFKPRIVMPPNANQLYTPQEYTLLLTHERMHLAMKDHWVNGVSTLLLCVFWFNPMVRFAATQMRRDQELSCDAHVSKRFPNLIRHYGELILKTQLAPMQAPIACQWSAFHPLKERIMQLRSKSPSPELRTLGMCLVGLSLVGFGFMAWAAQPTTLEIKHTVTAPDVEETPVPPIPVVEDSIVSGPAPSTPSTTNIDKQKIEAARAANEAADPQGVATEDAERARAAAERASKEARAQAVEAEARRAADEARMHADNVRRASVEERAQARAESERAAADRVRMDAERTERAAADKVRMDAERIERAARDAATQAEAARIRAEAESARAVDAQNALSDAARVASSRRARAEFESKLKFTESLKRNEKQNRASMALQAAERSSRNSP